MAIKILLKLADQFKILAESSAPYIAKKNNDNVLIMYGPFPSIEEAKKAEYFNNPYEMGDKYEIRFYPFSVETYSPDEILSMMDDSESFGYSRVKTKKPPMSIHPTWLSFFKKENLTPEEWWKMRLR